MADEVQPETTDGPATSPRDAPSATYSLALGNRFSSRLLMAGFVTGLVLAVACLVLSSYYLITFENHANAAVSGAMAAADNNLTPNQIYMMQYGLSVHMYIARILLLSCGIFAGLAFGFLGFSLFLIGVDGAIRVDAHGGEGARYSVVGLAPGAFVILCAAVLIGLCARGSLPAKVTAQGIVTSTPPGAAEQEPGEEPTIEAPVDALDAADVRSPEEAGAE